MTEIQSAIGLGELKRFDKWNLPQRKKLGKAGELDGSSAADILGLEEDNSDT